MEAKDAINLNLVKTDLNLDTKDDILHALARLLQKEGKIEDSEGFVQDVYVREKEGQTGIGHFIAIPHGKSSYVKIPSVAIGVNKKEIPWESLDDRGVRVVILFAVGKDSQSAREHLKLLSLFARKLGNEEVVERLLAARTPNEVFDAFV